ncbi:6-hydroxymethylpterin diphosphokinase MptE-like protein [Alteromonas sp. M12]|uniref:6-hydroxymethylpterin diphosphokinase MptE-like protein n=1 Tax=Alteromonas sp. M12 TaxID=3135644 RepID=UPI00319EBB54
MLKNIRLHIEKDEEKQEKLDQKLAATIVDMQHKNINSFTRNIPSLVPTLKSTSLQNHSLFSNKYGEINIVDYGIGRTLYGFHPLDEVTQQVQRFEQHSPKITLSEISTETSKTEESTSCSLDFQELDAYQIRQKQPSLPEEIECLVVLGCGLGLHLEQLLRQHRIKYLIVYEPQIQYFQCSTLAIDWSEIFALAKSNGTGIFLQIEKDGRNIVDDIQQLQEHEGITEFRIFKHYNHPIFDAIFKELSHRPWADIKKNGFKVSTTENYLTYVPSWTPEIDLQQCKSVSESQSRFTQNLKAFEKYYPAIYKQFKSYTPQNWLPIHTQDSEVNLLNRENLTTWYGESPIHDCELNFKNFYSQPNKDGLVLGYSGKKLAHYEHYKFVKKTEELLKRAEDEIGELPSTVASIIMFGLGGGYQLEHLLANHKVEKLFICEPNSDFFYASLFAIDWTAIFEKIEKTNARIYLNIGDDGSHLFRDLLSQFHSIGPYILNNTYFYQSYYNSALNSAIGQLREQLQVVISMGEYFDHAYYGIAHTKEGMRRKIPVLTNNPSEKLSYDDKEVPIFIVGNGPSLDSSIEAIKEWQDKAIVVSCGTALQVMYKNGIVPDFHAEIEQNRSTYDWATLIGSLDFLKKITLISCNGVHPDTCDLYKDVLIAFKEGESSTVSALHVLGEKHFEVLKHAFPTVSNFVCNIINSLGFTSVYFMGVDLGFVDVKHHHSKDSGYYLEDGEETYDYAEKNNTSIVVPGNFRATVNTKHEFKVSRQIIEQVTAIKSQYQTFYNCSDGAKIHNTTPLHIEELLIIATEEQKQTALKHIREKAFSTDHIEGFTEKFESTFLQSNLIREITAMEKLLSQEMDTQEQVNQIIAQQKAMLFHSYRSGKSLLFYYLYGTVNYANALLLKLSLSYSNKNQLSDSVDKCMQEWRKTINGIKTHVSSDIVEFDTSEYRKAHRENLLFSHQIKQNKLLVVTNSSVFSGAVKRNVINNYPELESLTICNNENINEFKNEQFDYVIYYVDEKLSRITFNNVSSNFKILGDRSTLVIMNCSFIQSLELATNSKKVTLLPTLINPSNKNSSVISNLLYLAKISVRACLEKHHAHVIYPRYIIPEKGTSPEDLNIKSRYPSTLKYYLFDFPLYTVAYKDTYIPRLATCNTGTRGTYLKNSQINEDLLIKRVTAELFNNLKGSYLRNDPNLYNDTNYSKSELIVLNKEIPSQK